MTPPADDNTWWDERSPYHLRGIGAEPARVTSGRPPGSLSA
ncbi:hypothetical protein [Actinocorallia aurea]